MNNRFAQNLDRAWSAARRAWERFGDLLLAACCLLLSLVLYLQTLAPTVVTLFDDSLEFPLVAQRLAIAHPTGYPLYTLLARLFILASPAQHNVAWAVNLLSAVAGAVAVAVVYLIARELTRRRLPALLGAAALAVSPVFWSQAVVAEVYSLHSAFVAALLWLALRWARQPLLPVRPFSLLLAEPEWQRALFLPGEGWASRLPLGMRRVAHRLYLAYRRLFPAVPPRRRLRPHLLLYALAALLSLSLTHHRTALLLIPALFIFGLFVEPRFLSRAALLGPEHPGRPRWLQLLGRPIVLLTLSFLLPLLLYLYLPLRGSAGSLDGTYQNTWRGFWQWVMASGYSGFFADNPLARDLDAAFYAGLFWQQFGPVGLALALVGIVGLLRQTPARGGPQSAAAGLWFRRSFGRKALALTGLAFLTYAAFAVVYQVPDVEVFFIPAFLITAVWIATGLDYAADLLRVRGQSLALRRLLAAGCLLLFLAAILQPLLVAARTYPDLDLSQRWTLRDYGWYLLDQELPSDSTVVGILGEMSLLRYLQDTTGRRADVETVVADDEAARRAAVDEALAEGRTVFVTRPLPGLNEAYALDAVIGLIDTPGSPWTLAHVGPPTSEVPPLPRPVGREIVPGLELLGYGVREHHGHWQAWARLRLWWRAPEGLAESLKFSARLVDAGGQVVATTDSEPVAGLYPTAAWRPGEVVADAYEIPLPAGLPPGDYRPLIIVYDPASGAERGRAELDAVYLQGNPQRPPQRALEAEVARTVYARFGEVELLGYTPPDPAVAYRPGETLPLALLWQALGEPQGDLRVAFWLEGVKETPLGEEPLGGRFPAGEWAEGQVVRQWPALDVPADTPAGAYRLKMRVSRDNVPLPWGRGLIPLGSDLDLGPMQIGR
jgi:hypothetical protein